MNVPHTICPTVPSLTSGKLSLYAADVSSGSCSTENPGTCLCDRPATWFLVDCPDSDAPRKSADELTASELFEELCDTCFHRVMGESERPRWVRIER